MIKSWGEWLKNRTNRIQLSATLVAGIVFLFTIPEFFNYIEKRNGIVLDDTILALFNPVDLTWLTFSIIYLSLIVAIINFASKPAELIFAIQFYLMLMIVRMTAMYLFPLEPPLTIIPLADPFIQTITTGEVLHKDLFFSGHTATLFFLFLIAETKILKTFFLISTIIVAVLVLLQHVHYTIDVFSAPFFTYGTFRLILLIRKKINLNYL